MKRLLILLAVLMLTTAAFAQTYSTTYSTKISFKNGVNFLTLIPTGLSESYTLKLPTGEGTTGQVLGLVGAADQLGWITPTSVSEDWTVNGNTSPSSNIFGTLSADDVVMQTNAVTQMTLLSAGGINIPTSLSTGEGVIFQNGTPFIHSLGSENFFAGTNAGNLTATGDYNVGIGRESSASLTTGSANTSVGANSLRLNTTGMTNVAIGDFALTSQSFDNGNNSWYADNTAVGHSALQSNNPTSTTNGISNTAIGANSMTYNTIGFENTAVGVTSLHNNAAGTFNTAVGYETMRQNTYASENTAVGHFALRSQIFDNSSTVYSSYNTAIGNRSLFNNNPSSTTDGINNTAIGYESGLTNITGASNTYLGSRADASAANFSNATAIGNGAVVNASNKIQLGNASVTRVSTNGDLSINSLDYVWPTAFGVGVLTSDINGNLSWSPGGGGVTSVQGTLDQVLVNNTVGTPQTGAMTLTLPQDIGTASTPVFGGMTLSTLGGSGIRLVSIDNAGLVTPIGPTLTAGTFGSVSAFGTQIGGQLGAANGGLGIDISGAATGSMLYTSGAGVWAVRAAGNPGDVLTMASGVPTWAAPGGFTSFTDNALEIKDNTIVTKKAMFQASGIAAATTRVYSFPDADGTLMLYGPSAAQTSVTLASGLHLFNVGYAVSPLNTSAVGGNISSVGGTGGSTNATGLTITTTAYGSGVAKGIVLNTSSVSGTAIDITSPDAATGKAITIQGGTGTSGLGGGLALNAGTSTGAFNGAAVTIASSDAGTTGIGGAVTITTGDGAGSTSKTGGAFSVTTGDGGVTASNGGAITLTSGNGGLFSGNGGALALIAGNAGSSGIGGVASLIGGNGVGTDRAGGGVIISGGNSSGSATSSIIFKTAPPGASGSATRTAVEIARFDSIGLGIGGITPTVSLDVDGAIVVRQTTAIDVTADNQDVTPGDRTYLQFTSDGTAGARDIDLQDGVRVGQIIILHNVDGADAIRIADNNNTATNGNVDLGPNDTATMIWDGSNWVLLATSNN